MGMVIATSVDRIIGSVRNDQSHKAGELADGAKRALGEVTTEEKYSSRSELDNTGRSKIFDDAHATLLRAEANKTTLLVTKEKLRSEFNALSEINDAVVGFEKECIESVAAAGTKAEKADRALTKIAEILGRKNLAGDYIFGGNNPRVNPLSYFDGNQRISVDLTKTSNIVSGKFINNFTDVGPNDTVVTVSENREVNESFLNAGMDAIVKTIGYLNSVKEGVVDDNTLAGIQAEQKDARGRLFMDIRLEMDKIDAASTENMSNIAKASEILENFKGDIVENSQRAADLMTALTAQMAITNALNKVFNNIVENVKV